ncbi:MAG: hypothetical protein KDB00_14270 [Planctomycetales bacterium]|nr:hypothetical protein [Planctomycetales bacterium]
MNLLIIWLIVSVVSTALVLLSIRFAPTLDDEPLDSVNETLLRVDSGHQRQTSLSADQRRKSVRQIRNVKIIRSDANPGVPQSHSKGNARSKDNALLPPQTNRLGHFAIVPSEEPQA